MIPGWKQAAQDATRVGGPGYEQVKSRAATGPHAGAIAAQPAGARKALAAEGFSEAMIDKAIGRKGH